MGDPEFAFPPRPYVPPTAFLAASMCASSACVLEAGWRCHGDGQVFPREALWCVLLVGVACVVLAVLPRVLRGGGGMSRDPDHAGVSRCARARSGSLRVTGERARYGALDHVPTFSVAVACVGAGALMGGVFGLLWLGRWQAQRSSLESRSVSSLELMVRGDPNMGAFGVSSMADVYDPETGEFMASVRMTSGDPYEAGTRLTAVGRMKPLGDGGWDRSRFMKGEVASVQVVRVLRRDDPGEGDAIGLARRLALQVIEPKRDEARALLAGTVCGRTTELAQTDANEAFSRCGLSHLVAVSGGHLALIALLLDGLGGRMGARVGARRAISLVVMVAYVLFTGCAASAVRSVAMVGASMASTLLRRRAHQASALSIAVCGLVLLDPAIVFDLGFQLSAMSVFFLLVFGSYVSFHLARVGLPRGLAEPLAMTFVAQWATLPLTVPIFGEVSLIAPFANLLVGPFMSALLVCGLLATPVALLGPWAGAALAPVDALARMSITLAEFCASAPFTSVVREGSWMLPLGAYGAALVVYLLWSQWSRFALACGIAAATLFVGTGVARWMLFAPASVTVLDVGQGDSILIRDGPRAVLVDAGVDDAVLAALARNNVFSLDAVVVTHWDRDHWGGLPHVLDLIPVKRIVVAEGAGSNAPSELSDHGAELIEVSEGDRLRIGSFACEVVWPKVPVAGEENAESLCLDVAFEDGGGRRLDALLTGDTERDELAEYAGEVGDIDVFKVGHHGSEVSVAADALDILKPELAVASAGEGNAYGHPDPACVSLLEQAGAHFLCTKDVGDVVIEPGISGPVVKGKTFKETGNAREAG